MWEFSRSIETPGKGGKPQTMQAKQCTNPTEDMKRQNEMLSKGGCSFSPVHQPPRHRSIRARTVNLAAVEIKACVPAKDFELSKRCYLALGFEVPWSSEDLAPVRHGNASLLLQAFDAPQLAENHQMHLLVENVDDWHAHVVAARVAQRLSVAVGQPTDRPWALRVFTLSGPSGALWRVARNSTLQAGASAPRRGKDE